MSPDAQALASCIEPAKARPLYSRAVIPSENPDTAGVTAGLSPEAVEVRGAGTLDASATPFERGWIDRLRRGKAHPPVRTMTIVMINEDAKYIVEMMRVDNEKPIETLRANSAHKSLRHSVGSRSPKWRADDLDPVAAKHPRSGGMAPLQRRCRRCGG